MRAIQILILYNDEVKNNAVRNFLTSKGYYVYAASDNDDALQYLKNNSVELFLTDDKFADNTYNQFYQNIKLINPMILVIKLNVQFSVDGYVNSINDFEFFEKMMNTLEVLENTRSIYRYKIH